MNPVWSPKFRLIISGSRETIDRWDPFLGGGGGRNLVHTDGRAYGLWVHGAALSFHAQRDTSSTYTCRCRIIFEMGEQFQWRGGGVKGK